MGSFVRVVGLTSSKPLSVNRLTSPVGATRSDRPRRGYLVTIVFRKIRHGVHDPDARLAFEEQRESVAHLDVIRPDAVDLVGEQLAQRPARRAGPDPPAERRIRGAVEAAVGDRGRPHVSDLAVVGVGRF